MQLLKKESEKNCVITGSVAVSDGGKYYNRLFWVEPNGAVSSYDKRHLFRMGGEHHNFAGGSVRLIVELKGWRICPLICYDLRFPVWSRNFQEGGSKKKGENIINQTSSLNYDLVIYVANWPAVRSQVWDVLLQARAIENQSFCIGVNRVGSDGMGLNYTGNSAVIDFKGNALFYQKNSEVIDSQVLNKKELDDFRAKFPAYLDADDFEIML